MPDLIGHGNSINSAKSLNDTDGVPMNIVVYQIVAILEVLTFADTIGSYQDVYFFLNMRIDSGFLLGTWRKQSQHFIKVQFLPLRKSQRTSGFHIS